MNPSNPQRQRKPRPIKGEQSSLPEIERFEQLDLIEALQRAVREEGYTRPTPIQGRSIPHVLQGRDLLGVAQTGTGKTAAFSLPVLQGLKERAQRRKARCARSLILTPTRELAIQVAESFKTYGRFLKLSTVVIFGGVGQNPQVQAMRPGCDVLVATPGRLLDLMNQGHIRLDQVEVFILDEADRMLDMGFIHDVRKVLTVLPRERQSLFFSATMPKAVANLARQILRNPLRVDVDPERPTVEAIEQGIIFAEKAEKRHILRRLLTTNTNIKRALVFTRTKHGANRVVKQLGDAVIAEAIHGNKSQSARQRALGNFKTGQTRVLVATDIAARGIDVEGVTHVFNYDLPNEPESYVHRIGRTARAGASGHAISLCQPDERPYLKAIERLISRRIPKISEESLLQTQPFSSPQSERIILPRIPKISEESVLQVQPLTSPLSPSQELRATVKRRLKERRQVRSNKMSKKLFVGGLAWATDDNGLHTAFEQFGEVIDAKVITDRETGRSRGFGFVTFEDDADADRAIEEMNGSQLDGRSLNVNEARDRGPRGGGGGGGGRGGRRW